MRSFLPFGIYGLRSTIQIPSFPRLQHIPDFSKRTLALVIAVIGLCMVYINQRFNYLGTIGDDFHPNTIFVVNRTIRYLLNDSFCILIIYALFNRRSYILMGLLVEFVGLVILLPLYFVLKLSIEGDIEISSPLFSFFHRLIINPTLMILLIVGMFYQQKMGGHN